MKNKTLFLCQGAVIAALYVVLTYIANAMGLASGAIQVRFSEALCVLPIYTAAAVPGLFAGCLIANILCGGALLDIVFGSLATLIGAAVTYKMRNSRYKILCTLPPVISNAVIMPFVLKYVYSFEGAIWYFAITVGIGEIISCCIIGYILYKSLEKYKNRLFK